MTFLEAFAGVSAMKSYRFFYPDQFTPDWRSEPVQAANEREALRLLCEQANMKLEPVVQLRNLQVMQNGVWVWVL